MGLGARPVKDRPLSTDMADGLPAELLTFYLELNEIVRRKGILGHHLRYYSPSPPAFICVFTDFS